MIRHISSSTFLLITLASLAVLGRPVIALAQTATDEVDQLKRMVRDLQSRVATLEQRAGKANTLSTPTGPSGPDAAAALAATTNELKRATATQPAETPSGATETGTAVPLSLANLPGGATLNYMLDGYYEYNFNQPPGRVNDLRAYDVLSNAFSINQADIVFALDPNVVAGRRYGFRVDLQFGQATETSQGNPANEPRPDI